MTAGPGVTAVTGAGNGAPGDERRVVRSSLLRVLSGLGVLVVTGAVVAAGTLAPPAEPVEVSPVAVTVEPPSAQLVCQGPLRVPTEPEPGGDVAYDPQFDPSPEESSTAGRVLTVAPGEAGPGTAADPVVAEPGDDGAVQTPASGSVSALGAPDELAVLTPVAGAAAAGLDEPDRALVITADPAGDAPAWVAGAVVVRTDDGDVRGLAASSCQQPAPDAWLVGGSTELGSSARLVLQNPGLTAATVHVELWGPAGPVDLAGAPEYLVPAGSERVVLLEGVAAEQRRLVVHLSAAGGLVTAYLQDSRLRGLVPAGVDLVVPGQGPAPEQVISALSVTSTQADGADTALLRLLATGPDGGTARITLHGPDGAVPLPGTERVALEAGAVLDVPLGGLPAGDYTAVVRADVPVVAGAMLTRGAGVGEPDPGAGAASSLERAWAPSVRPGAAGPLALPQGAEGRLLVAALPDGSGDRTASVTVDVVGGDGELLGSRVLRVPVGTTLAVPLDDLLGDQGEADVAGLVVRTADTRVAWSVLLVAGTTPDEEMVSVLTPVPPAPARSQVPVRLR